jgi:hypothetical protein
MKSRHLVRHEWVSACGFHELDETEVLNRVLTQAKSSTSPIIVLDLDSTLYEVRPRTFQILKEWREKAQLSSPFRSAMEKLDLSSVGYSLKDTFRSLGLESDFSTLEEFQDAKSFWSARFFSSEYLKFDHAYEGAVEFCKNLHGEGAELVYLTGRDEVNMGEGTRLNLLRDGFPLDSQKTHMMLKKSPQDSDVVHKKDSADWINRKGKVVASFENEPVNLIALYEQFPQSMHIFVDTICSDHPAQPREGLYRIRDWT